MLSDKNGVKRGNGEVVRHKKDRGDESGEWGMMRVTKTRVNKRIRYGCKKGGMRCENEVSSMVGDSERSDSNGLECGIVLGIISLHLEVVEDLHTYKGREEVIEDVVKVVGNYQGTEMCVMRCRQR